MFAITKCIAYSLYILDYDPSTLK